MLSVLTFHTLQPAIGIANSMMFGLPAGIFTRDVDSALLSARQLRAGTIWVTGCMDGCLELPFGGYNSSGEGCELGRQAVSAFTQSKAIQLQVRPRATRWVPAPQHLEGRS